MLAITRLILGYIILQQTTNPEHDRTILLSNYLIKAFSHSLKTRLFVNAHLSSVSFPNTSQ
jgi:hypothetical protein